VIDFGIRGYDWDLEQGEWVQVFPKQGISVFSDRVPEMWNVMMRVLSDRGVQLIEHIEQGRLHEDWWERALKNSEVFQFQCHVLSGGK
jgi:hypothetical protein